VAGGGAQWERGVDARGGGEVGRRGWEGRGCLKGGLGGEEGGHNGGEATETWKKELGRRGGREVKTKGRGSGNGRIDEG